MSKLIIQKRDKIENLFRAYSCVIPLVINNL